MNTSSIICITAEWRVQPGQEATVQRLLLEAAAAVRQREPGNLLYAAHQAPDDATRFLVYEQYANEAALQAHLISVHYKEIVAAQIVPLLVERTVTRYRLLA